MAAPLAGAIPLQTGASVTVRVTPGNGGPRTTFWLALHDPFTTGPTATLRRSETVDVSGPHRRACVLVGSRVPDASAQQLLRVALSRSRLGTGGAARWCMGTFHGSVVMTECLLCTATRLCPAL